MVELRTRGVEVKIKIKRIIGGGTDINLQFNLCFPVFHGILDADIIVCAHGYEVP